MALERRRKKVPLHMPYFVGMLGESVVYALVFGFIVATATQVLLGGMVRFAADGGITNMPLMDGLKLVSAIRQTLGNRQVPIVVITTESAAEDRARALSLGANAYLVKPVQSKLVVDTVKGLLKLA